MQKCAISAITFRSRKKLSRRRILSERNSDIRFINRIQVFIKNIDNVVPERSLEEIATWKEVLGGYLLKVQEQAFRFSRMLEEGADFITLAKRYSISPSRAQGGDLDYIERGKVGKEFERAAFALKKRGELSDIVKAELGYHIIRLEDRIGPRQRTFSEVQEEIRNRLRNKKREEILAAHLKDLREEAQITIHEGVLATEEKEGS